MTEVETVVAAPVFALVKGRRYPQDGKLIGPAWEAGWAATSHEWVVVDDLVAPMIATGVSDKTARNLLANARKGGHLEVRYVWSGVPKRCRGEYRRPASPSTPYDKWLESL